MILKVYKGRFALRLNRNQCDEITVDSSNTLTDLFDLDLGKPSKKKIGGFIQMEEVKRFSKLNNFQPPPQNKLKSQKIMFN